MSDVTHDDLLAAAELLAEVFTKRGKRIERALRAIEYSLDGLAESLNAQADAIREMAERRQK